MLAELVVAVKAIHPGKPSDEKQVRQTQGTSTYSYNSNSSRRGLLENHLCPHPSTLLMLLSCRCGVGQLVKWNLAVRMLYCLVDFIKVYDARVNLGAVLKVKHKVYDVSVSTQVRPLRRVVSGYVCLSSVS